jgi:uncharacterized protein
MHVEKMQLGGMAPGLSAEVVVLHFGKPGARPKTYIQAGLHADEAPGMLAAHHLRRQLAALDVAGNLIGHVVLVPAANPIGLAQHVMGTHHGRFDLSDGKNFNRDFPDLVAVAGDAVDGRLTDDAATNTDLIRQALKAALASLEPVKPSAKLKHALLSQAIDADVVLDLHCDGEADMHLYTLGSQATDFQPLADFLGATAMLVADVSGDNPFDEAASRTWHELSLRFPDKPIARACIATTVELRGEADVRHDLADSDATAIMKFLGMRGHTTSGAAEAPASHSCAPTPLAGSEALEAPSAGILVFIATTGQRVDAGALIAEVIDPSTGMTSAVHAGTSGIFYARASTRFATAGRRIGKIAGHVPFRTGRLLSP